MDSCFRDLGVPGLKLRVRMLGSVEGLVFVQGFWIGVLEIWEYRLS